MLAVFRNFSWSHTSLPDYITTDALDSLKFPALSWDLFWSTESCLLLLPHTFPLSPPPLFPSTIFFFFFSPFYFVLPPSSTGNLWLLFAEGLEFFPVQERRFCAVTPRWDWRHISLSLSSWDVHTCTLQDKHKIFLIVYTSLSF